MARHVKASHEVDGLPANRCAKSRKAPVHGLGSVREAVIQVARQEITQSSRI